MAAAGASPASWWARPTARGPRRPTPGSSRSRTPRSIAATCWRDERMSKEIVEAVHVLEREKGISAERLMEALEDALLSAYKKQPGAARYARVDMDRDTADFIVYELLVPEELQEQPLAEIQGEGPGGGPA